MLIGLIMLIVLIKLIALIRDWFCGFTASNSLYEKEICMCQRQTTNIKRQTNYEP
jgi:hypothetical protein